MSPFFVSDESVKSVINYSISVDSVLSVDYLFSTEDTDKHGFLFCVFCVFCGLSFFTRMVTDGCPQANEEDIVYHRNLNGIYTEVRWRCSVSTALIIYPQMSDRCYTDFHLFQICLTSVDCIGPQADGDVVRNCHEYPAMFINIFITNWRISEFVL